MHITLRSNEKIYINGAVLKADRKVSIELMNDAIFLLEAHVMLEQDAKTLMRQLYFIVQTMLMEPDEHAANRELFNQQGIVMAGIYKDAAILEGLIRVAGLVEKRRHFEALKVIRGLIAVEDKFLNPDEAPALAKAS